MKKNIFGKYPKLKKRNFYKWSQRCGRKSSRYFACEALSTYDEAGLLIFVKPCNIDLCPRYGCEIKPDDLDKRLLLRKYPSEW